MPILFHSSRYSLIITLIWALLTASVILTSIQFCDDRLIYTLDDPYIHMKVAQTILQGGYGVNLSEYSSPSSSVLYPLMLAGADLLGMTSAGPLILNLIAGAGAVYLGSLFLERHVLGSDVTGKSALFLYPLGVLLIFAVSAVALPMTGLEHSWHVYLVVAALFGLVEMLSAQDGVSWGLIAAIVLIPLVRFEGVAFSCAAILALALTGHWKPALTAMALMTVSLVAYGAIMSRLGLPLLPASVLLKSNAASAVVDSRGYFSIARATLGNLIGKLSETGSISKTGSLNHPQGILLLVMIVLMFRGWALTPAGLERRNSAVIAAVASFGLIAHIFAGKFGWFARYEVYVVVLGLLAVLFTLRYSIRESVTRHDWNAQIVMLLAVAIVVIPYLEAALVTPLASRGIYEQQFQMHRFVTNFYREPVAVNDLGWVSYKNDAFVLDLEGLGSEPVRRLRMTGTYGATQMSEVTAHYGIGLVMIYESWFGSVPPSWRRIAIMHTESVTSFSGDVSFFVTPDADIGRVTKALADFQSSLPRRVTLEIDHL
jgi:hypothetical protein